MSSNRRTSRVNSRRSYRTSSSLSTSGPITSSADLVGTLDLGSMATDSKSVINFGGSGAPFLVLDLALLGDRIARVAGAFARWKGVAFRLRYIPSCGSTTAGSLVIAFVDDPGFGGVLAAPTYAQVVAMRAAAEGRVWNNLACTVKPKQLVPWLYTTTTDTGAALQREGNAGVLYAVGLGLAASTTFGEWVLDYHCVFAGNMPVTTPTLLARSVPMEKTTREAAARSTDHWSVGAKCDPDKFRSCDAVTISQPTAAVPTVTQRGTVGLPASAAGGYVIVPPPTDAELAALQLRRQVVAEVNPPVSQRPGGRC